MKLWSSFFKGATQYFPSARQMMKLVWDEQEAWMSYLQLITCLSHDACHNTGKRNNLPSKYVVLNIFCTAFNSSNGRLLLSGQNIFTFYKTGERYDLKLYLELAVYNWFNEYQVTRLSEIDSLTFTANNFTIGHFTQMIHDKSVLFGCSVVEWTEDNGNKKFTRVSCDYQKANYAYKPVYERGIACSGCAVCDEDDFYGLCLAWKKLNIWKRLT